MTAGPTHHAQIHSLEAQLAAVTQSELVCRARIQELLEALRDVTEALGKFVDTNEKFRKPYEHPLSAYDRAIDVLAKEGIY